MRVRIIGNDHTGYRIVSTATNTVLAVEPSRALAMLVVFQMSWEVVNV